MWVQYLDESFSGRTMGFFVYGGVVATSEQAGALVEVIQEIRERLELQPGEPLKFGTNTRPARVSISAHRDAKSDVIAACESVGARFVAGVAHHAVDRRLHPSRRWQPVAQGVIDAFEAHLREVDEDGLCVCDWMESDYGAAEFFTRRNRREPRSARLNSRVRGYAMAQVGWSSLAAVADILVGSFGYAINEANDEHGMVTEILPRLMRLMLVRPHPSGRRFAYGRGFTVHPDFRELRSKAVRGEYDALIARLKTASRRSSASQPGSSA